MNAATTTDPTRALLGLGSSDGEITCPKKGGLIAMGRCAEYRGELACECNAYRVRTGLPIVEETTAQQPLATRPSRLDLIRSRVRALGLHAPSLPVVLLPPAEPQTVPDPPAPPVELAAPEPQPEPEEIPMPKGQPTTPYGDRDKVLAAFRSEPTRIFTTQEVIALYGSSTAAGYKAAQLLREEGKIVRVGKAQYRLAKLGDVVPVSPVVAKPAPKKVATSRPRSSVRAVLAAPVGTRPIDLEDALDEVLVEKDAEQAAEAATQEKSPVYAVGDRPFIDRPPLGYRWGVRAEPRLVKLEQEGVPSLAARVKWAVQSVRDGFIAPAAFVDLAAGWV